MMSKEDTVSDIIEQIPFVNGLDILGEEGGTRLVLHVGDCTFRWADLDAPLEEVRKILGPFNVTVRTKITQVF